MRKRDRMRSGSVLYLTGWNYPKANITPIGKDIDICIFREKDKPGFGFKIERRFARMLAKRINQALEESA